MKSNQLNSPDPLFAVARTPIPSWKPPSILSHRSFIPFPTTLHHYHSSSPALDLWLLAAAALRQPSAVGLLHVVELVWVTVVLALSAPEAGTAAAVPARAAGLELLQGIDGCGLVCCGGSKSAGHDGSEEENVELHVEFLVF
ncbi:hypothetical protein V495_03144 [Pseudogymnoascus sp. VKM F-4514 (FW-929)]|nr:hypothetical protein V490_07444 [Pseudogymnoascus sp. VKM F-3557]KFY45030.1 hypothetical protein V495_03144 [Pseudogymnoascus sp. VKM F-4514 (FW-929)]KFY58331.1 hypothetical protein V497_04881 [Pseudogymnoascus sp. VKM F-4516 (FW-969)]